MSNNDEFNFGGEMPEVRNDLYDIDTGMADYITWHGKISGDSKWGFWAVDRGSFVDTPVGWEEHQIRFGANPNNPLSDIYYTYRLRCCPIAVRRRWVVESPMGDLHYYPWYTKGEEKVDGQQTSQVQVLVRLPDDDLLRVLALRGFTKSVCWDNNPNHSRGVDSFPKGVVQVLAEYADRATVTLRERNDYTGDPLPILCAWWVDLIPLVEEDDDGKKVASAVHVGHSTYMNPYVADMSVGKSASGPIAQPLLKTRFVGQELFREFQEIRAEVGIDWEHEWSEESVQEPAREYDAGDDEEMFEEDEIPF